MAAARPPGGAPQSPLPLWAGNLLPCRGSRALRCGTRCLLPRWQCSLSPRGAATFPWYQWLTPSCFLPVLRCPQLHCPFSGVKDQQAFPPDKASSSPGMGEQRTCTPTAKGPTVKPKRQPCFSQPQAQNTREATGRDRAPRRFTAGRRFHTWVGRWPGALLLSRAYSVHKDATFQPYCPGR